MGGRWLLWILGLAKDNKCHIGYKYDVWESGRGTSHEGYIRGVFNTTSTETWGGEGVPTNTSAIRIYQVKDNVEDKNMTKISCI